MVVVGGKFKGTGRIRGRGMRGEVCGKLKSEVRKLRMGKWGE